MLEVHGDGKSVVTRAARRRWRRGIAGDARYDLWATMDKRG